jgi:hypothetical protein
MILDIDKFYIFVPNFVSIHWLNSIRLKLKNCLFLMIYKNF